MSALHIPKEIKPELDVFAFAERERTGHTLLTSTKLAGHIFVWAFEKFRESGGNLKRLKSAQLVFPTISDDELWDRLADG